MPDTGFDLFTITLIAGTFLIAGTVKGVIGLGLPSVSLGLLTVALDLTTAMALLVVPSLVTNFWQAVTGGNCRTILARTWPFLLTAAVTVWIGAAALTRVDLALLSALLGALLVAYASLSLAGFRLAFSAKQETWAGPLFGIVNGILTGMTGSFVVPGVLYLQSIGLTRDSLVQAMGLLFTASTAALACALQDNGILNGGVGAASAVAVLPAAIGMAIGQRIRHGLQEDLFRRVFFCSILALGAYILLNAVLTPVGH